MATINEKIKKTRPQSAAKNQLQPSKVVQCVTNFTYKKARQNLNQKTYMPECFKNTDMEKLYEEKLDLKKQLNEMQRDNQQQKTQILNQQLMIKKKDEMVQQVMKQVFRPSARSDQSQNIDFINDFQSREIQHKNINQMQLRIKNQNNFITKDSQITQMKLNMKEINEKLQAKEKELQDLKQTMKFTKIKEFEIELALNVQESQRLRALLQKQSLNQRINPKYIKGLQQQNINYQQIVQNLQQNLQIQTENYEKLNQKYILQIKKFSKLKDARKKIADKNERLERKLEAFNNKFNSIQKQSNPNIASGRKESINSYKKKQNNIENEYTQNDYNKLQNLKYRCLGQTTIIEKLLNKMSEHGIDISEEELHEMQNYLSDQEDVEMEQEQNQEYQIEETGEVQIQQSNNQQQMAQINIGIVTLYTKNQQIQKNMQGQIFSNYEHLKQEIKKEFEINTKEEIEIKFQNRDGVLQLINSGNWNMLKNIGQQNIIQLVVEILNFDQQDQEKDPSNYEDENFEQEPEQAEIIFSDPIKLDEVKQNFQELRLIFQIKKINKQNALQYILHGLREQISQQKIKKINIKILSECFVQKIGFSQQVALNISKYLLEIPDENGKIQLNQNVDFQGQTHEQYTSILRKNLNKKLLDNIKDYNLYNGLAITSMLTRIQQLFEDYKIDLIQELEDQDYDDVGTCSINDFFKSMKLVGLNPDKIDEELLDFLHLLALRPSVSLNQIDYKMFSKIFDEDYSFIEDKQCLWDNIGEDGELASPYEPSSDDGELESESSPIKYQNQKQDKHQSQSKFEDSSQINENEEKNSNSNIDDLEQNELLEKVDEILMLIVQKLPQNEKIRSLTQLIMQNLIAVYDEKTNQEYLIINQNDFIDFLIGSEQNQLNLPLDEGHIVCLLHLLSQENESNENNQEDDSQKYIQYDEFIDLIKTFMKKEKILKQSKNNGVNYEILSKESVEYLFQIRSSLMHDNNINENSADEDEQQNYDSEQGKPKSNQQQKSLPVHIRQIFGRIIQTKNIQQKKAKTNSQVEVMDFEQMLDILMLRLGIQFPSIKSQEELKFLICLDFKYLEMVSLNKLDKVLHDLDYISIDLLRQALDQSNNNKRKTELEKLKQLREIQLSNLKEIQAKKSNKLAGTAVFGHIQDQKNNEQYQIYGTNSQQIEFQGQIGGPGVTNSTFQEKKKKRPDDKKQKIIQKVNNKQTTASQESKSIDQLQNNKQKIQTTSMLPKKSYQNIDQDLIDEKIKNISNSNVNKIEKNNKKDSLGLDVYIGIDVEKNSSIKQYELQDEFINEYSDEIINENIQNIEQGHSQKNKNKILGDQSKSQNKNNEKIESNNSEMEYDEDYLQDDIPIDDDDEDEEDEEEEGVIQDNYENYDDDQQLQQQKIKVNDKFETQTQIQQAKIQKQEQEELNSYQLQYEELEKKNRLEKYSKKDNSFQQNKSSIKNSQNIQINEISKIEKQKNSGDLDDNIISMDHSDDINDLYNPFGISNSNVQPQSDVQYQINNSQSKEETKLNLNNINQLSNIIEKTSDKILNNYENKTDEEYDQEEDDDGILDSQIENDNEVDENNIEEYINNQRNNKSSLQEIQFINNQNDNEGQYFFQNDEEAEDEEDEQNCDENQFEKTQDLRNQQIDIDDEQYKDDDMEELENFEMEDDMNNSEMEENMDNLEMDNQNQFEESFNQRKIQELEINPSYQMQYNIESNKNLKRSNQEMIKNQEFYNQNDSNLQKFNLNQKSQSKSAYSKDNQNEYNSSKRSKQMSYENSRGGQQMNIKTEQDKNQSLIQDQVQVQKVAHNNGIVSGEESSVQMIEGQSYIQDDEDFEDQYLDNDNDEQQESSKLKSGDIQQQLQNKLSYKNINNIKKEKSSKTINIIDSQNF